MPRVITNANDYETWESAIAGLIVLKKFDRRGEVVDEIVRSGGKIYLTPDERRYNQEIAAAADLDPFQNGMLIPLRLVESADDADALKGNPNHITEKDMRALLANSKAIAKLRDTVEGVSNPVTLQRFLAIAEDPEVDATLKQINTIKERLAAVSELPSYIEVETVSTSDGRQVVQTSAPKSPAPRNPSAGRR